MEEKNGQPNFNHDCARHNERSICLCDCIRATGMQATQQQAQKIVCDVSITISLPSPKWWQHFTH